MTHIALLFTNYGPYHLARLNAMHQLCQKLNWQATALELARSEAGYAWQANVENLPYPFVTVFQNGELEQANPLDLIRRLYATLAEVNPSVVAIAGYSHPAMLAALLWCRWHRKPAVLLAATWEQNIPRSSWRETVKRWIVRQYQAALVGGQPQKRYLSQLGIPLNKIFTGYNTVDNDAFHPSRIQSLPNSLNKPFFLSVVRFIFEKNLPNLLDAYALYCQKAGSDAWDLVLCGDGPLRSQVEAQIEQLEISQHVHLPGFLQQNQLFPYFAHANGLILASLSETWGLVVNEAMAAALPILVSKNCGCYEDLVVEGVTGWGFEFDNIEEMAKRMLEMSADPKQAKAMGEAGLNHIQKFSPDCFAQGLAQAIQSAAREAGALNLMTYPKAD